MISIRVRDRILLTTVLACYVAIVALGVAVHEPWWDEAQAWLLARDAPIGELLTRDLAYEGHPPLWYLILAIPAKLHLPYKSIDIVAAVIGLLGVVLLHRLERVPIAARLMLPFTYYCAYQYTVVARSYVLVPPLLFAILALYERRDHRILPFSLLLVALSNVSLYGFALAGGLVALFLIDLYRGRLQVANVAPWKGVLAVTLFLLNAVVLAVILRIPADLTSRGSVDLTFRPDRIVETAWSGLAGNLIVKADEPLGVPAATAMLFVLALWLWRRDVAVEFVVLFVALLPIASIYFGQWHEGIFFWAMTFVILLALSRPMPRRRIDVAAYAVLVIALCSQAWWTFRSLAYDARENFTGSRDAARYIAERGIDRAGLFGAGARCIEVQPYFDHNIFANYHGGRPPAFWDWTGGSGWTGADPASWMAAQLAQRPSFFLVSISASEDLPYKEYLRRRPDYRLLREFRGARFWKDSVFRRIDFRLYERVR